MKEKVLSAIEYIRNTKYFVKVIIYSAICLVTVCASLGISNVEIGYRVSYGENTTFIVKQKSDFEDGKNLALGSIDTESAEESIYTPEYATTLTLPAHFDTSAEIAEGILNNTAELKKSAVLSVNGEKAAIAGDEAQLNELLNNRLNTYNVAEYKCTSTFTDEITISNVYCKESDYTSVEDLNAKIEQLNVKTTVKYTTDVVVNYKTVTKKTASQLVGYKAVTTKGENGLNHNVVEVTMLNGQEIDRRTLEQDVVKAPVSQVITVGTGASSADIGASMLFPLPRSSRYVITCVFGEVDGSHVHKGIDYAAPKGTSIYASGTGRVVRANKRSDYGWNVVIDHGNGIKTLYAHASKLYVSAGETVTRGQVIAEVGSTGWSTGNHLHFEIMVNGQYVNPAKYVG